jgi:hypothetical protein
MSRVTRRAGTKALACSECQRSVKGKQGSTPKTVMSFRGKGKSRLLLHIEQVHRHPRQARPREV